MLTLCPAPVEARWSVCAHTGSRRGGRCVLADCWLAAPADVLFRRGEPRPSADPVRAGGQQAAEEAGPVPRHHHLRAPVLVGPAAGRLGGGLTTEPLCADSGHSAGGVLDRGGGAQRAVRAATYRAATMNSRLSLSVLSGDVYAWFGILVFLTFFFVFVLYPIWRLVLDALNCDLPKMMSVCLITLVFWHASVTCGGRGR